MSILDDLKEGVKSVLGIGRNEAVEDGDVDQRDEPTTTQQVTDTARQLMAAGWVAARADLLAQRDALAPRTDFLAPQGGGALGTGVFGREENPRGGADWLAPLGDTSGNGRSSADSFWGRSDDSKDSLF